MIFHLDFAPQFQRNFKRLTKKNTPLRERVLKRDLAGKQSAHVAKHWVIIYQVLADENNIEFQNFDHHDYAYGM
jgi:mRNA-degrading endonuclease YafQ of YafQ-DinJ toxin-antitoxin module